MTRDYSQLVDPLHDDCPVKMAIDVIRGRWKPMILSELNDGTKRFCDLQSVLAGVTSQALTVQLRQLEADGVIVRRVFAEVPARVEYALTELGQALCPVMTELHAWGERYQNARRKT